MPENYGQSFPSKKKNERKAELADRYWFDCNCEVSGRTLLLIMNSISLMQKDFLFFYLDALYAEFKYILPKKVDVYTYYPFWPPKTPMTFRKYQGGMELGNNMYITVQGWW